MANIPVHAGSWFGLPDFGITERISDTLGKPRNTQGGSTLRGVTKAAGPTTGVQGLTTYQQPVQFSPTPIGPSGPPPGYTSPQASYAGQSNVPPPTTSGNTGAPSVDYGAIDSAFNDSNGILNNMESNLRGGEQNYINQYTNQVDAQKPLIEQAYNTGIQQNQSDQNQENVRHENAISAARRLYHELTQGAQARFGGANSASEFSNAFLGGEFQKNVGNIQQNTGQNIQKLVDKHTEIQNNYQAQLQSLAQQRAALESQARDQFRQQIDAINNSRLQLSQGKAQAKLDALQNLRSYLQQLNSQSISFQQQLQLNSQQAAQQLAAQAQAFQVSGQTPTATNPYGNAQYSTITQNSQSQPVTPTGYYDPTKDKRLTGGGGSF